MVSDELYKNRLIDEMIQRKLRLFGAVQIDGPKWCGKTTTATHHSVSAISLADPSNNYSNKAMALMDPNLVLEGETPRLIDEWQEVPLIKDAVRFKCDQSENNGLYILTGSSVPTSDSTIHSGAGRISKIRMLTMSLYETGDSSGEVSIRQMFDVGLTRPIMTGEVDTSELIRFCARGGWPKAINYSLDEAKDIPADYIRAVIDTDLDKLDGVKKKRNKRKVEAIISAMAKTESYVNTTTDCLNDITETDTDLSVSRGTFLTYSDTLTRLYLLEDQPGYVPNTPISKRTNVKASKHRFTDPSLVLAALKMQPNMLLNNITQFERIFDNLCVHDLRIYAEALDGQIYHYRDGSRLSADAVIELSDGRWAIFNNVLYDYNIDKAAAELLKIEAVYRNCAPSFCCVISGTSKAAYRRPDGVIVVPLTALKP